MESLCSRVSSSLRNRRSTSLLHPPRGPDQAAPVVVNHDHEVPAALLVRGLVDADPADAVGARGARRPPEVAEDAPADAADAVPFDAARPRHGRHGAADGHPRRLVLERPGEARPRPRSRDRLDADAVLQAPHARGCVLQVAFRCPQVERAPPPRLPASVVGLAGAAACRAATLLEPVWANPDDDGVVFDADGFNDGIGQGEGKT